MRCPNCGAAFSETDAYCGHCGNSIAPDHPNPGSEGNSSSQAERRRLTVMFCDLVGSTELSGRLDPEELHDLIRQYQQTCAEVIGRYGGHVAQFLGDGLLVYFGYPLAHEDDARRAVSAGLDIVTAISQLRERLAKSLQVRVAIHTGLAVVGQLGDGTNPDALVIAGETPNIAGRLQSIADPGTVIISAPTYQLIQGFFLCRSLGAPTLKGVAAPIELYSVIEESGIQSRFEQSVAAGLTPFVSRETEIALLLQCWKQARDGSGQVVLLSGEAGIGKSRLMRMLKERTAGEAVTDLAARCSPYYQDSALYPIIGFFEYFLQFQRDDSAETKLTTLEAVLENFGFPLAEAVPLFAALLSLPSNHRYPPLSMTPQRQKQKTFEAIVAWLLKAAERHPTRVVFEDVHWADPSTLELLGFLIAQMSQARLFVGLVFRSEFLAPWRPQPHVASITLGRLSRTATESMIESVADGKELPTRLVHEIVAKTEGVPLFVEELTRMVLESGMLQEQDGRYTLTSSLPSLAIPSTLYESLMARLDRLGTAKEVAQLAATIGKEFSYELLRAISPLNETKLTGALTRLVDAELLDQHLLSPQSNYTFRHALIRDAAYESLLRSKRRQYHRKVAEVLQEHFPVIAEDEQFPTLKETHPEVLARHWTEAGEAEPAIAEWTRAGERAVEQSAYLEAERHYQQAIALLQSLAESSERNARELGLQVALGSVMAATRGWSASDTAAVYARARSLAERAPAAESLQLYLGLWSTSITRGELRPALALADQMLETARNIGSPPALVTAHWAEGHTRHYLGDLAGAGQHFLRAIEHYREEHFHGIPNDLGVTSRYFTGLNEWHLGHRDQAARFADDALSLARRQSNPFSLANALTVGSSQLHILRGDFKGVLAAGSEAMRLSTASGFPLWNAISKINVAWAHAQMGQTGGAVEQIREGLAELNAIKLYVARTWFLCLLCETQLLEGAIDEARVTVEQALQPNPDELLYRPEAFRLRAELQLKQGDTELAVAGFLEAIGLAQKMAAKSDELRATMSLAHLLAEQNERGEARTMLAEIYNWFTEGFDTADLKEAKALLDELAR